MTKKISVRVNFTFFHAIYSKKVFSDKDGPPWSLAKLYVTSLSRTKLKLTWNKFQSFMTPFDAFYERKFMNHKNVKQNWSRINQAETLLLKKSTEAWCLRKKSWVQEEVKLILTTSQVIKDVFWENGVKMINLLLSTWQLNAWTHGFTFTV